MKDFNIYWFLTQNAVDIILGVVGLFATIFLYFKNLSKIKFLEKTLSLYKQAIIDAEATNEYYRNIDKDEIQRAKIIIDEQRIEIEGCLKCKESNLNLKSEIIDLSQALKECISRNKSDL